MNVLYHQVDHKISMLEDLGWTTMLINHSQETIH